MVGNSSVGSSINVSALKAGLHTVFVKLVDDVNYVDATSDTLTVNVVKASNANITISITPLNPIYGDKVNVNITVPTDADGKVLIVLDNKTTIIKAPGESYTFVPSNAGEHTISVSLVNDTNYMNTTNDAKFNVAKKNTLLIAPSLIKYYLSNDKLVVILKDSTGKILANKKVTIKINTVTYNLKTDSKGVAKLLIRLNPKSYVADIKFTGTATSLTTAGTWARSWRPWRTARAASPLAPANSPSPNPTTRPMIAHVHPPKLLGRPAGKQHEGDRAR